MAKMMRLATILLISCTCLLFELSDGIRLTKKNLNSLSSLSGLMSTNLTSISYSSQIVDKNRTNISTDDTFLIDIAPTQNTKSKLYTIKKSTNGTINTLTTFKYKRNNTERSIDARQTDFELFKSFGCDPCISNNDPNCINNQTCHVYFKCSNSSVFNETSTDFNSSTSERSLNPLLDPFTNLFLIEKRHYCDGLCDCPKCEDEINCSLRKCDKSNEIMCQDKSSCIEPKQICDSIFNCRDHSDEIECFDSRGCVASGRFSCDNHQCLERALVCDGLKEDCLDKSDEDCECYENEFRCFNGQCIKKSQRCNGIEFECMDGSDEFQCVLIDERDIVLKILPDLNHGVLCADTNFTIQEADEICRLVGKETADEFSQIEIELENGTQWVSNFNFWSSISNIELNDLNKTAQSNATDQKFNCKDNLAQTVTCKKFNCSSISRDFNNFTNQSNHPHIDTPKEIESTIHLQASYIDQAINETRTIECYAQIISPVWLLSSFNCLNSFLSNNIKLDSIYLNLNHRHNLTVKIKRIILHPHSSIYRSMFIRNFDLGLAQLDKPIIFEEKGANAICLPIREIDLDITCFLINFNETEPLPFLVVDRDRCNQFNHFNNTVIKDNLCAIKQKDHEEERKNFFHNATGLYRLIKRSNSQHFLPTGSPLICLNSDSKLFKWFWFLAGFVNYSDERNNLEHPTIFSNVFRMLDFINRVTGLGQS